jgi:hypothetical protein
MKLDFGELSEEKRHCKVVKMHGKQYETTGLVGAICVAKTRLRR